MMPTGDYAPQLANAAFETTMLSLSVSHDAFINTLNVDVNNEGRAMTNCVHSTN